MFWCCRSLSRGEGHANIEGANTRTEAANTGQLPGGSYFTPPAAMPAGLATYRAGGCPVRTSQWVRSHLVGERGARGKAVSLGCRAAEAETALP